MKKIKVLIVDDQNLMRDGLKTIIDLEEDIEVVATCQNGVEAIEKTKLYSPDVILMDIRMPEMNGVEATKLIKHDFPDTIIIILTTFDDDEYIMDALSYGASGYLLKDIDGDKLIDAIRDAHHGTLLIPGAIAAKLVGKLNNDDRKNYKSMDIDDELSKREIEIAGLMVEGLTNKQIASKLFITEGTVKNYISTMYSKIGIKDRTKAVLFFKQYDL
ncbi:MAG: response regulator transcription factor [Clostridiaceae bacterium]|nr:response regulator transcription factor [Clostridiaceae bacterium]